MIKNSTFVGNSARFGGAIFVKNGGTVYVNTQDFSEIQLLKLIGRIGAVVMVV